MKWPGTGQMPPSWPGWGSIWIWTFKNRIRTRTLKNRIRTWTLKNRIRTLTCNLSNVAVECNPAARKTGLLKIGRKWNNQHSFEKVKNEWKVNEKWKLKYKLKLKFNNFGLKFEMCERVRITFSEDANASIGSNWTFFKNDFKIQMIGFVCGIYFRLFSLMFCE